jgi:large subunit ribosomal protein L6
MAGELKDVVEVPSGVTVTIDKGLVKVKGKAGELARTFAHPDVTLAREGNALVVRGVGGRKKTKALVGTWSAHLRNMVKGAAEPFEYKLKVVYSHFPIKAKVQGDLVLIDNFLGEKTSRKARVMGPTKVKVAGDEVVVTGPDVEAAGQTAANIEQACRIKGYDPKVFQDGIYIVEKGA